jgi:hypothetical protein
MRVGATAVQLVFLVACAARAQETAAPAESTVRALLQDVAGASSCGAQQAAFDQIEQLGCAAVPELVQFAADPRALVCRQMRLRNLSAGSFEATRHYSPQVVGDAVQALLTQITGQYFGDVYNGSTSDALHASARRWDAFVARTKAIDLCTPFVVKEFVIVRSTASFQEATGAAADAAAALGIRRASATVPATDGPGLTFPPETCRESALPYPCYVARGRYDDGAYVSIEWSDAYEGFAKGLYLVMVASGAVGSSENRLMLGRARERYADAYAKRAMVYLGCLH